MKFNTTIPLTDRFGDAITEKSRDGEERAITLGIAAVRAIDLVLPEDKEIKPEEIRKRDVLACKLISQNEVELTSKEISMLKERICNFGTNIAGQLIKVLDGENG